MSIDRIGKGGGGPPVGGIGSSGTPSATEVGSKGEEFKVQRTASATGVATEPLDRLRSGEITVSQYLDIKVEEATSHLDSRVSAEQLSFIRDSLRQQLASDPMLVELVQSATGSLPSASE